MPKALFASIAALATLGLLGGCLVLAQDGFTTSSKRGGWEIFVPAPQAYVMAAIMFALSAIAVLWLLQQTRLRPRGYLLCAVAYLGAACLVTSLLTHALR